MKFKDELLDLIKKVDDLEKNSSCKNNSALPENCYFLEEDCIVCYSRELGDSRYPYSCDGLTLWAHSSGYLVLNESTFYAILRKTDGKEPHVAFFGGQKQGDGSYQPISLFDITKQPNESKNKRFMIYQPKAAYYVVETQEMYFALRAFITDTKQISFSMIAINKTAESQEIYLSSYMDCFLMHGASENVETNWFKSCEAIADGFVFDSVEDLDRSTHLENSAIIKRVISGGKITNHATTTARAGFTGGSNVPLICSNSLFSGKFKVNKPKTKFTDTAIAADIVTFSLAANESCRIDYRMECCFDELTRTEYINKAFLPANFDEWLSSAISAARIIARSDSMLKFSFGDYNSSAINSNVLNKFLASVVRQVDFAAFSKNSGVSLLGVRDVFQQLEASLLWDAKSTKAKIIEALGFLDISGRPPRQYSIPIKKGAIPIMDLRAFIDQGVWIVNTIYAYLSHTQDYSILNEVCGYYEFLEGNSLKTSDVTDTVLQHLIKILQYLIKNIDYNNTHCLRALYGDWNDALDGLGITTDKGVQFGDGVSVMASLQLYQSIDEMSEILAKLGGYDSTIKDYKKVQSELKDGLIKYAIETDGKGNKKIIHGWGDKMGYKVGSFCDPDGKSRDTLSSNAFWVISDAYKWDKSIKNTILDCYKRLDSKFGLKTFEPYFPKKTKGVGRIINLPQGTAENAATYTHATLFGIWSLFKMGESKLGWEQLEKILPITHSNLSSTPFVMSNSYSYNTEYGMDGESMSDWYTGSANVLLKILVRYVFGVYSTLDGVFIQPAKYFPTNNANISIKVCGCLITLNYLNKKLGKREIYLNNKKATTTYNSFLELESFFINNTQLKNNKIIIDIID